MFIVKTSVVTVTYHERFDWSPEIKHGAEEQWRNLELRVREGAHLLFNIFCEFYLAETTVFSDLSKQLATI